MDIDSLYELAALATPGPWWIDSHGHAMASLADGIVGREVFKTCDKRPVVRHEDTGNLSNWKNDNDATYIASANPLVIMELIDRLRKAENKASEIIKGDCYEAGLWSMSNVDAMVRDGNVVNSNIRKIDREAIIGILLSAGNMSEGVIADAIIAAIGSRPLLQTSDTQSLIDRVRKWGIENTGNEPSISCFHRALDELVDFLIKQNRVNSNDAKHIINHFLEKYSIHGYGHYVEGWMMHHCQPMLEKLNANLEDK